MHAKGFDRGDFKPLGFAATWWAIGILSVSGLVSILDRSTISVMLVDIRASLSLSDTQISLAQGLAFASVYCLGSLYIGGLADRCSRRVVLCLGMIVWSLAASSTALATGFVSLVVVRMLIGLGEATITPCAFSIMSQIRHPDQLAGTISIFVAAGTAGTGVAFALGGALLDQFAAQPLLAIEPWRQVMIVLGLPGVAVALLVLTIREPSRAMGAVAQPGATPISFLTFMRTHRKPIGALLAAQGLTSMMVYSAMGWGAAYGRRVLDLPATEIGAAMGAIAGFGGIIGAVFMGQLVDRLTAYGVRDATIKCYVVAACISVPLSVVGFLADDKAWLLAGLIGLQIGVGSTFGAIMAMQQLVTPQAMRGRMGSLTAVTSNIVGFGLGPLSVGLLTDHVYVVPNKVGWSIATVLFVAGLTAPVLLWRSRAEIGQLARSIG